MIKNIIKKINVLGPVIELILFPLSLLGVIWFRIIKFWGTGKTPLTRWLFINAGMIPVVNHYYEPFPDFNEIHNHSGKRLLSGVLNFDPTRQIHFLQKLKYNHELNNIPLKSNSNDFFFKNNTFEFGDAELYYSVIRFFKPRHIIEIGSGFSTLIALKAINKNFSNDNSLKSDLICIEPFEYKIVENKEVSLIKSKVEEVDLDLFKKLDAGDILFIDSSHVVKPHGDVTHELLEILPDLNPGVLIHFHDIFSPYFYPPSWIDKEFRLWNEQYLLEAFLAYNNQFEVLVSMHYLHVDFRETLYSVFPLLSENPGSLPSSFWIRKK